MGELLGDCCIIVTEKYKGEKERGEREERKKEGKERIKTREEKKERIKNKNKIRKNLIRICKNKSDKKR